MLRCFPQNSLTFVEVGPEEQPNEVEDIDEAGPSKRKMKKKPLPIVAYNKGKIGIDISDQMSFYETCLRKGVKWFRKLAVQSRFGISFVNAVIVYEKATDKKIPIKKIREEVAIALLGIEPEASRVQVNPSNYHFMKNILNESDDKVRRKCKRCYESIAKEKGRDDARKLSKAVYIFCKNCPGKPFLCFKIIHEKHH